MDLRGPLATMDLVPTLSSWPGSLLQSDIMLWQSWTTHSTRLPTSFHYLWFFADAGATFGLLLEADNRALGLLPSLGYIIPGLAKGPDQGLMVFWSCQPHLLHGVSAALRKGHTLQGSVNKVALFTLGLVLVEV